MKIRTSSWLIGIGFAALAAACGGAPGPRGAGAPPAAQAPPAEAACAPAVDHLFSVTADDDPAIREVARGVFVSRCEADAWSTAVRACLARVAAPADADACERLLAKAQRDALRDDLAQKLEAAGVGPRFEHGGPPSKPKPKPKASAPAKAPAPEPAKATAAPRPGDPCEGGE